MILVWHQSKQPININWFLYMASVIFLQEEFLQEKEEVNRTMKTCPRLQSAKRSTSQILLILEDKKSWFHLVSVVRLKGIHFSYKTFTWQIQIRNKFWSRKLTVASWGGQIAVWARPKNLVWQKSRPIFFGLAFGLAVWQFGLAVWQIIIFWF